MVDLGCLECKQFLGRPSRFFLESQPLKHALFQTVRCQCHPLTRLTECVVGVNPMWMGVFVSVCLHVISVTHGEAWPATVALNTRAVSPTSSRSSIFQLCCEASLPSSWVILFGLVYPSPVQHPLNFQASHLKHYAPWVAELVPMNTTITREHGQG